MADTKHRLLLKLIKKKFKTIENAKKVLKISYFFDRIKKEAPEHLSKKECMELLDIIIST